MSDHCEICNDPEAVETRACIVCNRATCDECGGDGECSDSIEFCCHECMQSTRHAEESERKMSDDTREIPTWQREPLPNRLMCCVGMLRMYDLLSDAEKRRVMKRFHKRWKAVDIEPKKASE